MAYYQYIAGDMRIKQYDANGELIVDPETQEPIYYKDPNSGAYPNVVRIYATEEDAKKYIEEGLYEYKSEGNYTKQINYASLGEKAFKGHESVNWVLFCGGPSNADIEVPKKCFLRSNMDTIRY
jgi:hypothetical protein